MAADEGKVKIEKFDGADFGFWKMHIEDFLYQKNLYQPLSGKQPEGMKDEDWALLDRQALGVIRLTLSRNVAFNIAKENTTVGLMTALSSMYEKPSASNKVHLMRRLFNLRMAEGASVAQHLNELNTITTQLSSVEIEFDDEVRALILLSSLPDSWNATVTAVSSSLGNSKLKFDDVRDLGHFKRDCRALKKDISAQESANVTEETGDATILSINSPIESWILDSGASFHSTPYQEIMENYVSGDFGKVHLADDETLKIVGKGDIRLKLPNQTTWKLTGVRHISGLKRNLISVGQLDGEGYSTTFSGCEWKITKGALVIARGKKTGTLYVTSNLENIIAVADADGKSNLWHQRLGHMSEKGMKILLSKGKLPDLKNVDVGLCEDCIFGKQKKVSFTKIGKTPKAERKWKAMVENETGLKVKRLRSDNGGEYRDSSFRYFCANNGIKMETTVPITPQQNGVAERMNRTLNERARNMRIHAGLPKFLWAEAINTAAYLINRGPSVPLDGGIPEEAWSKKEINLSRLRVFGCISYVHINSAERSKLDVKSNKCVFVGYGGDEFGYRFWDYENRKIIRSRDVIFNENVMYKDRSTAESSNTEAETKEFAEFEDISENDVQINPEAVQEEQGTPELRRSSRIHKPTQRYSPSLHYLLLTDNGEPECYDEAMQVEDSVKWEFSMKDEMDSLMSNQTWELAELPPDKKALHNKWIYRIKEEHNGSKRYKARLVVKGFQQKEAAENLHLEQLDVKTAFLHGDLEEEIYMRQPEGFIEADKKNLVCRLKNSLYGLKQTPRQWYKKFDSFMSSNGFIRCQADHCCYIKRFDNSFIILLLYVDDMLVAGSDMLVAGLDMQEIIHLKQKLSKQFAMKDLGAAKQILGMRIKRDTKSETLMLSQAEYINKVLSRFNMQDAKSVSTPLGVHFRLSKDQSPKTEEERAHMVKVPYASAIGSLMYAMVCTRPDIAHAVGAVSRYMNNPGKVHWEAVKWILRYLRGTTNKALCFKGGDMILTGYVDADLAGNVDIRMSTTGYVYTLGGTAVSWVSQLQKIVALSTTEAEYVAVTEASKEMDKAHTIEISFYPSLLEDGILKLEKISGAQNPADMLTKTYNFSMTDRRNTNCQLPNGAAHASGSIYSINLENFSKLATPPPLEDLRYLKSSALNIWLLGYEFAETIMVFTAQQIHFLCSQKKASLLDVVKKSAKEAVGIDVVMYVKAKTDDGTALMDAIFRSIRAQHKGSENAPIFGYIAREAPKGKLLETWAEKLKRGKFTHAALMDETEKAIVKPQLAKVKLKPENVDICYPPIFQSGGETFLIDATPLQSNAYEVLLKAHEAAIGMLKPGNIINAAYQAALSVVEKEAPDLVPNLTKSAGTRIGLEFRESGLTLNAKNERVVKARMVFNVSLGFQNLQYVVTRKSSKAVKDVAYSFNEDEDEEEKYVKAETNGYDPFMSQTVLRSDNHEISKEELRRQHQAELARQKNEETARRLAGGPGTGDNRADARTLADMLKLWFSPQFNGLDLEFDQPLRELGFHGVPYKASAFIVPTSSCLVELIENPFLVVTLSEIEIVNLERVGLGQKNFDMTIVFRDLKRDVLRIDSIPSTSLDGIKEWLDTTDLKYYESRLNLNWRQILKTITDDPQSFIENGGWEFLNLEASDSDSEDEEESDQGYEPSDMEPESESEDDDTDSASLVESEDEEEEDLRQTRKKRRERHGRSWRGKPAMLTGIKGMNQIVRRIGREGK
ncbi:FACT complex subunit SPT16-like [Hibiscus syriacus]|uniref:FACT complex subunit n=1 Tax=Hibiscus syriacus TaxID=106335 RepID=A0A6A3CIX0_HIBSY|nr:FACT complex subunit SPT16-like [Hibiscus syriacus]